MRVNNILKLYKNNVPGTDWFNDIPKRVLYYRLRKHSLWNLYEEKWQILSSLLNILICWKILWRIQIFFNLPNSYGNLMKHRYAYTKTSWTNKQILWPTTHGTGKENIIVLATSTKRRWLVKISLVCFGSRMKIAIS